MYDEWVLLGLDWIMLIDFFIKCFYFIIRVEDLKDKDIGIVDCIYLKWF